MITSNLIKNLTNSHICFEKSTRKSSQGSFLLGVREVNTIGQELVVVPCRSLTIMNYIRAFIGLKSPLTGVDLHINSVINLLNSNMAVIIKELNEEEGCDKIKVLENISKIFNRYKKPSTFSELSNNIYNHANSIKIKLNNLKAKKKKLQAFFEILQKQGWDSEKIKNIQDQPLLNEIIESIDVNSPLISHVLKEIATLNDPKRVNRLLNFILNFSKIPEAEVNSFSVSRPSLVKIEEEAENIENFLCFQKQYLPSFPNLRCCYKEFTENQQEYFLVKSFSDQLKRELNSVIIGVKEKFPIRDLIKLHNCILVVNRQRIDEIRRVLTDSLSNEKYHISHLIKLYELAHKNKYFLSDLYNITETNPKNLYTYLKRIKLINKFPFHELTILFENKKFCEFESQRNLEEVEQFVDFLFEFSNLLKRIEARVTKKILDQCNLDKLFEFRTYILKTFKSSIYFRQKDLFEWLLSSEPLLGKSLTDGKGITISREEFFGKNLLDLGGIDSFSIQIGNLDAVLLMHFSLGYSQSSLTQEIFLHYQNLLETHPTEQIVGLGKHFANSLKLNDLLTLMTEFKKHIDLDWSNIAQEIKPLLLNEKADENYYLVCFLVKKNADERSLWVKEIREWSGENNCHITQLQKGWQTLDRLSLNQFTELRPLLKTGFFSDHIAKICMELIENKITIQEILETEEKLRSYLSFNDIFELIHKFIPTPDYSRKIMSPNLINEFKNEIVTNWSQILEVLNPILLENVDRKCSCFPFDYERPPQNFYPLFYLSLKNHEERQGWVNHFKDFYGNCFKTPLNKQYTEYHWNIISQTSLTELDQLTPFLEEFMNKPESEVWQDRFVFISLLRFFWDIDVELCDPVTMQKYLKYFTTVLTPLRHYREEIEGEAAFPFDRVWDFLDVNGGLDALEKIANNKCPDFEKMIKTEWKEFEPKNNTISRK